MGVGMFRPGPGGPGAADALVPVVVPRVSLGREPAGLDAGVVEALVSEAYAAHQRELFGFLLHVTRDPDAAEDIAQEAFLRLCRELKAGAAPPDNVRAWLYRVSGNLAISRGRHVRVARRWLSRSQIEEEAFEAPERTAIRFERHERLEAALDDLPREQRLGLLMAARGFSGHEIAEVLGRSDVSTRTMLCRARFRLRSRLERDDGG
jgi:RNA polymerase sigma-70 factor, ECF subfamily